MSLFDADASKITLDTHLYEDLEIDSIDAIDLIDHIKRQTGYKLRAEDFRNVRTGGDVITLILSSVLFSFLPPLNSKGFLLWHCGLATVLS